jgi:preprotein translocase subunit SecG
MYATITTIHVLSCIFLILVVLLQTGKGADMGAVFGGSSSTVFGSSGAGTFLTRLTTATAIVFMLTSLSLTYFSARRNTATVFDSAPAASVPEAAPVAPAPGAPAPGAPAPVEPAPQPEANAAPPAAPAPADSAPVEPATN